MRLPYFERILGVYCFILDTTHTHTRIYTQVTNRSNLTALAPTHPHTLALTLNTLLASVGQHSLLITQLPITFTLKLDSLLLATFRRKFHITNTDAPHPIFLLTKSYGL